MDNFLERNKKVLENPEEAEKAQFYELVVEKAKLNWFMNDVNDPKQRETEIWAMLEKYGNETNPYPKYLVRYASWFFLSNDKTGEAESLLKNHFTQKIARKENEKSEIDINALNLEDYAPWEAEYVAFIDCVKYQKYDKAKPLYEMLRQKNKLSRTAMLNLGGIYEAESDYNKAVSLYAEAARKTENLKEKSDIHYRIAQIQVARNDFASAELSLNYAVQLDSGNTRARLLLKKIK
jgi:tetratricopeptide (TPR) repeat protein